MSDHGGDTSAGDEEKIRRETEEGEETTKEVEEGGEEVAERKTLDEVDPLSLVPIAALAPKVVLQEEGQAEVSASPAFQCLDELFQIGKLTGTRVALLKSKYTEIHRTLNKTRDSETKLLQDAKQFTQMLEKQRVELEKADNYPDVPANEVTRIRTELLNFINEHDKSQERLAQQDFKMESLKEEKNMLEREYSRMPKKEEVERQTKELNHAIDELKLEIGQRQMEGKNLKEDLDTRNRQIDLDNKELEDELEKQEKLKEELVTVHSVPGQLIKEMDRINKRRSETQKQVAEREAEYGEMLGALRRLEGDQRKLEEEKYQMNLELEKQKQHLEAQQRAYDLLMKDYEMAKEQESVCMGDRATLDLSLRHIHLEKKSQHDLHARRQREKDRDLRTLKKTELQFKVSQDSRGHIQSVYDKTKSILDMGPKDDGSLMEKRKDLQREVDIAKRQLANQNSLTAVEQVKVEQSIAEEERLLYEQSDLRIEVVELTRLATIKADEREQKARDFMRAELRYHRALEDLKSKKLAILDNKKKHREMAVRLKDFAKMYDVIKNERNKCVNLIQTSTQKAAEMREKIKILQNEIEILRTSSHAKERLLQKARLKHLNAIVVRDQLRNELGKQQRLETELSEKREQQKMDMLKLNQMINQAEDSMVKLKRRFENAVQHRNDRGVELLSRNDEVCIFYEKINIQDDMVRKGEVELLGREEEIRFLKMQVVEENRNIALLRRKVPDKKNLGQELVTLQIQLSQCQDRISQLERELENPDNPARIRLLKGKEVDPAELNAKIEELEIRLSKKEEQLLEKDLILENANRLSERVQNKTDSGKEDTLNLAKKVNELQSRIKDTTRSMMSVVSELSMRQAQAVKLQQQVREKEAHLEQAYMRMEQGEAPSQEMAQEWERLLRDDTRRRQDRQFRRMASEDAEQYDIGDGVTTTAEPRPNAYIPDEDADLPIPRPYGGMAPFKPQEAGANIRHIRKPVVKPIEI